MQPAAPRATGNVNGKDIIFYDGTCGLCHRFVRWTLAHDPEGKFRLSPLQGETLRQAIPEEERAKLPDSVVVLTTEGKLLSKSAAARYVAEELGQRGRARFIGFFPRWLADLGYDMIARSRYMLFGRNRGDMCPLVPPELHDRFLP
jgi:predicted DCC family thiol-disulfide oxidoreductase YuxK